MNNKDICRHLAELTNLIHREIVKNEAQQATTASLDSSLSRSSSCIINYLYDHSDEDVFQRDLEREFQVRRSSMSKGLTLLEQKGYINRVSVSTDHRLKKIVLTSKAHMIVDKIKTDREKLEQKLTANICADELEKFISTINKIKDNLKKEENA